MMPAYSSHLLPSLKRLKDGRRRRRRSLRQVADLEKVKSTDKIPENAKFVAIEGGNHAQFGSYGAQKGDGDATISENEQHLQTQTAMLGFLDSL